MNVEFKQNNKIFEWDEDKNRKNINKHGISFNAAVKVFLDKNRKVYYDYKHSDMEDRYITIGKVDDILFVVYTERKDKTRIISAREAKPIERRKYHGNGDIYFKRR